METGKRIRAAREALELTRQDVAGISGVQVDKITRWETGKNEPVVSDAAAIAAALGQSLDDLTGLGKSASDKRAAELARKLVKMRNALVRARTTMQDSTEEIRKILMDRED